MGERRYDRAVEIAVIVLLAIAGIATTVAVYESSKNHDASAWWTAVAAALFTAVVLPLSYFGIHPLFNHLRQKVSGISAAPAKSAKVSGPVDIYTATQTAATTATAPSPRYGIHEVITTLEDHEMKIASYPFGSEAWNPGWQGDWPKTRIVLGSDRQGDNALRQTERAFQALAVLMSHAHPSDPQQARLRKAASAQIDRACRALIELLAVMQP